MYVTLGAAAATLVVAGGILAGPAILECSASASGLGACLREKVAETGLVAPDAERAKQPEIVADMPVEPIVPAAPTGWMEANANEYGAPATAVVDLTGSPSELAAMEVVPSVEVPLEVAVAPVTELATAALIPQIGTSTVDLGAPDAALMAQGSSSENASEPPQVALVGPEGQIAGAGPDLLAPMAGTTVLAQPTGLSVEALPDGEAALASIVPEPVEPAGTLTVLDPAPAEPASVELQADVVPVEPPPVAVEFNPDYPNVLVLPAPASGEDSSFRSLQLN